MFKRFWFVAAAIFSLVLLFGGGCEQKQNDLSHAANTSAPPAALRVAVVDDSSLAEALRKVRGEWRAQSGAELEIQELTAADAAIADKLAADAVVYPLPLLGSLAEKKLIRHLNANWLAGDPLDAGDLLLSTDSPEFTWDGQPYAVPLGEPVFVLGYRSDLFTRFGKQPPRTWDEYQSLAEFFGDRAKLLAAAKEGDGKDRANLELPTDWSGTLEPLAPDWAAPTLLARAAAYAKHRDYFSVLFDRETMKPLIAGPPFVKALTEMATAAKTAHVELTKLTPADTLAQLLAGHAAMAIGWPSARATNPNQSASVAFAELPGATAAYNLGHHAWDNRSGDEERRITLRGLAGLAGSVVRGADHAEAAFGFLAWLAGKRWSGEVLSASPASAMFRQSQLEQTAPWIGSTLEGAAGKQYGATAAAALRRTEMLLMPRVPGQAESLAALNAAVTAVVSSKKTSQQALDEAAAQWQQITDRLGREKQLEAYRRGMQGVR